MGLRKLSFFSLSLLLGLLCVFFGMYDLDAAADQLPYSLTVNQTLALYGASIPGYYYNGASVEDITFKYVGDTYTLHNAYDGQDGTLYYGAGNGYSIYDETGFLNPTTKINHVDFLIYKWESPAALAEPSSFDFQLRLSQSIDITAMKFEEAVFWSNSSEGLVRRNTSATESRYFVYGSSVDTVLSSQLGFRPSNSDRSGYYGISYFALNSIDLAGESHDWVNESMYCQFYGSACSVGSTADDAESITVGSSVLNIKAAKTVIYPQSYDPDTGTYGDFSDPAVYLLIACPVVYGEYTLPDSGGSGDDDPSGDINVNVDVDLSGVEADLDTIIENQQTMISNQNTANQFLDGIYTTQTAQLNDIIAKLDDIYDEMVANGEVTVNLDIDASLENQTNALVVGMNAVGQFIVTGIRDMFIPSQADIINFRLNLEAELRSLFPAAYASEDDLSDLFYQFASVEAQDKIWFPGVDVSIPDVAANKSSNFQIAGQWVDLKPNDQVSGFHALYEAAALAIDLIATILFFNMLRNKFEGMMKPDGGD